LQQLKFEIMNRIKQWILYSVIARFSYGRWVKLREESKDEYNEKLCYCGHTTKCSCGNPDKQTFKDSVKRGSIILGDKNNGWKNVL